MYSAKDMESEYNRNFITNAFDSNEQGNLNCTPGAILIELTLTIFSIMNKVQAFSCFVNTLGLC